MKKLNLGFLLAFVFVFIFDSFEASAKTRIQTCAEPLKDEPILYSSDFHWNYEREEMRKRFEEVYLSPKRLKERAYYDSENGSYVMPLVRLGETKLVPLTDRFIRSIARHIEVALESHYADFVFFPDMGHSHFFIPMEIYEQKLKPITGEAPNFRPDLFYTKAFQIPEVKVLYHTAEQLKMAEKEGGNFRLIDDLYLQWRYFTRNLIGPLNGKDGVRPHRVENLKDYNSLGSLEGHKYYGGGFNLSANQNGCFEYQVKGKTYYFDISFKDLEPDPSTSTGDFGYENY